MTETIEYDTGAKTVGRANLVIVTTPNGLYQIQARGVGKSPAISDDRFTSLSAAKEAVRRYLVEHAPQLRKQAILDRGIERRQAAWQEEK
jgi:hypothetical protein